MGARVTTGRANDAAEQSKRIARTMAILAALALLLACASVSAQEAAAPAAVSPHTRLMAARSIYIEHAGRHPSPMTSSAMPSRDGAATRWPTIPPAPTSSSPSSLRRSNPGASVGRGAKNRPACSLTMSTQIRLLILDAHDRAVSVERQRATQACHQREASRRSTGRCLPAPLPPLPQHHRTRARALAAQRICTAFSTRNPRFSRLKTALPQRPRRFPFPSGPLCGTLDSTQPCAAAAWCFPAREAAKGFAEFSWKPVSEFHRLRRKRLQPAVAPGVPLHRLSRPWQPGRSSAGESPRAPLLKVESPERRLASPGLIY